VEDKLILNKREQFNDEVLERINNGSWGLKHIEYLHTHQNNYNLSHEDINLYILHVYRYTYNMAMTDGILQVEEVAYLNNIKKLYNHYNPPKNTYEVLEMRNHINALTKNFRHNQTIKHNNDVEHMQEEDLNLQNESDKVYKKPLPKYPRPKLTPYSSGNFWN
jgi:hypothetical protein